MMKSVCIFITCLFAAQAVAQFNPEFHSGYASYSNSSLKEYQSYLANNYLPGGKVLESFPAFWYYGVDLKWNLPTTQLGLSLSEGSTGGQVYYADYSGTFREQQQLKYTAVRLLTAARFVFNKGNTSLQVDPRLGLAFARLKVIRSVIASDGTQSFLDNQNSGFKAVNPFFEPTFSLSQKFGPLGITVFAGYHIDAASNIYRKSNGEPLTNKGAGVTMSMSGARAGGSIGFYLGRSKEVDFTRFYMGLGVGVDFGGIGLNAMSMVTEYVGLFGAVGYNIDQAGLNGGIRLYTTKQSARWRPYFTAMYGYNAVYIVKNSENFNRTFYGTSIGIGVDLKDSGSNFWTLAFLLPQRSKDVKAYKTYLGNSNIKVTRDILPFTISLGYRIAITKE